MSTTPHSWTFCVALLTTVSYLAGCASEPAVPEVAESTTASTHAEHDHDHEHAEADEHGGWWCAEHGVPEDECTRCDASLIAAFKDKSDWCDEHDLPASQCFKCDPTRAEPFIARYEAKFGKKPPAPTE